MPGRARLAWTDHTIAVAAAADRVAWSHHRDPELVRKGLRGSLGMNARPARKQTYPAELPTVLLYVCRESTMIDAACLPANQDDEVVDFAVQEYIEGAV